MKHTGVPTDQPQGLVVLPAASPEPPRAPTRARGWAPGRDPRGMRQGKDLRRRKFPRGNSGAPPRELRSLHREGAESRRPAAACGRHRRGRRRRGRLPRGAGDDPRGASRSRKSLRHNISPERNAPSRSVKRRSSPGGRMRSAWKTPGEDRGLAGGRRTHVGHLGVASPYGATPRDRHPRRGARRSVSRDPRGMMWGKDFATPEVSTWKLGGLTHPRAASWGPDAPGSRAAASAAREWGAWTECIT
jgi:hypothetical protein